MTHPRQEAITVERMRPPDHEASVAVLARAFWPDPLFGFFARGPVSEHHLLPKIFTAFLADLAPFGECWVARGGSRILGAACWGPPGTMPRTTGREARMQARIASVAVRGRNRRKATALLTAVDKAHPHEPHWYLGLLGTEPLVQGRGIAGSLLAPVLDRADAEGIPAYLETQKEENLAFYGRHGFTVAQEVRIDGAPPVWTMRREPR